MTKKPMIPPGKVLELARAAEERPPATRHPLIGEENDLDDVLDVDPGGIVGDQQHIIPPKARRTAPASPAALYCDSCGHVGGHAYDCPQQVMLDVQREQARDEALERAEALDSVSGMLRKLGATVLRKIAKKIDPTG